MNKTIELIAEGVLTNARILEKLLDQLPAQVREAVARHSVGQLPHQDIVGRKSIDEVVSAPVVSAPFNTAAQMIEYVTNKWRTLGPSRGAEIQTVLTNLGCENINDVTVDKYDRLYSVLESL